MAFLGPQGGAQEIMVCERAAFTLWTKSANPCKQIEGSQP